MKIITIKCSTLECDLTERTGGRVEWTERHQG